MTRGAWRRAAAAAFVSLGLVVAAAWWLFARTAPDRVGPRFMTALLDRHPGLVVEGWDAGVMRVVLPSGVYIDVRLSAVFDACRADRFRCSGAIDRALGDVDLADRATRDPRPDLVRAIVVGESTPGLRYGFVTDPLIGSLEVRYALQSGVASTFVTGAMRDRLGVTQSRLHDLATAALAASRDVDLVRLEGQAEPIWRVRSGDQDPVASLLDRERMKRFAQRLGSTRLYVAVPARGVLYLAPAQPAAGRALGVLVDRARRPDMQSGPAGLLVYDTEPTDRPALSTASMP